MDLPLVSASQIDVWTECERKWAFRYIDHVEVTKTPAAQAAADLGTEVQDGQIDPYLATGREFDFSRRSGEIALALKPLLPPAGSAEMWRPRREDEPPPTKLQLRRKFWMPSPTGLFAYQGEFDMWAPDSGCVPGLGPGPSGRVLLGDIKTSKTFDYAKDEEKLKTDIQCVIYKTLILVQDEAPELDAVWFYTKTTGAHRAQRYHLMVGGNRSGKNYESIDNVIEQFQKIDAIALQLVTTKAKTARALDLAPTGATKRIEGRNMCDSYGGCPYRFKCNLSPSVFAEGVNREAIMNSADFVNSLRKSVQGAPPAAAPLPAAPVVVQPGSYPVAPPTPEQRAVFAPPAPSAVPSWLLQPSALSAPPTAIMPATVAASPAAINPPEAALPPAPPVGAAASAEAPKRRGRPPKSAAPAASDEQPKTVAEALGVSADAPPVKVAELDALVARMRTLGVRKLALMEGKVYEIALFDEVGS